MLDNNYSQPTITYEQLLNLVKNLPQELIDNVTQKAKSLGISQSYINQGLNLINQIKNKN